MISNEDRLARAYLSLKGLTVGDAYGNHHATNQNKRLAETWEYSDDTLMALSIVSNLRQFGTIKQDVLADSFAKRRDGNRGYGQGVTRLLKRIQSGADWRVATYDLFDGMGSYGNGSAMRVAPLGAYFADDLNLVIEQARLSSEVTHAHPEGVAGAIAVAVASALATTKPALEPELFMEQVIVATPPSDVRVGLVQAMQLLNGTSFDQAAKTLGNGRPSIAQRTVPYALWALTQITADYKNLIEQTGRVGGDVDTNCAIVGGIVIMRTGEDSIPTDWLNRTEELPRWAFEERL